MHGLSSYWRSTPRCPPDRLSLVRMWALRERQEWKFLSVLPRADRTLAAVWWVLLAMRGALPAGFGIAMGVLVSAVQRGDDLTGPLALTGLVFVLLQVLTPIHQAVC